MPRRYDSILQKLLLKRKIEVVRNCLYEYVYMEMDRQRLKVSPIRLQSIFVLELKGYLN